MFKVTYHLNCKTDKPHNPEIAETYKTLKEIKDKYLNTNLTIFINWQNCTKDKTHHQIYTNPYGQRKCKRFN